MSDKPKSSKEEDKAAEEESGSGGEDESSSDSEESAGDEKKPDEKGAAAKKSVNVASFANLIDNYVIGKSKSPKSGRSLAAAKPKSPKAVDPAPPLLARHNSIKPAHRSSKDQLSDSLYMFTKSHHARSRHHHHHHRHHIDLVI